MKTFLDLSGAMNVVYDKEEIEEFVVVVRRIRQRRNLFVFQSDFIHLNAMV